MRRLEKVKILKSIIKEHDFAMLFDLVSYLIDKKETVLAEEVMDNAPYYNDLLISAQKK